MDLDKQEIWLAIHKLEKAVEALQKESHPPADFGKLFEDIQVRLTNLEYPE